MTNFLNKVNCLRNNSMIIIKNLKTFTIDLLMVYVCLFFNLRFQYLLKINSSINIIFGCPKNVKK